MRYIYLAKAENRENKIPKIGRKMFARWRSTKKGRQLALERQVERMLIALDDDVFVSRRLRRGREDVSFFAGNEGIFF